MIGVSFLSGKKLKNATYIVLSSYSFVFFVLAHFFRVSIQVIFAKDKDQFVLKNKLLVINE